MAPERQSCSIDRALAGLFLEKLFSQMNDLTGNGKEVRAGSSLLQVGRSMKRKLPPTGATSQTSSSSNLIKRRPSGHSLKSRHGWPENLRLFASIAAAGHSHLAEVCPNCVCICVQFESDDSKAASCDATGPQREPCAQHSLAQRLHFGANFQKRVRVPSSSIGNFPTD